MNILHNIIKKYRKVLFISGILTLILVFLTSIITFLVYQFPDISSYFKSEAISDSNLISKNITNQSEENLKNNFDKAQEDIIPQADEDKGPIELILKVEKGDTLMSLLLEAQIDRPTAQELITLLKKHFNPKDLKLHHEIYLTYTKDKSDSTQRFFESLYFRPNIEKEFWIKKDKSQQFIFTETSIKLNKITRQARGHIKESLYLDAGKKGVPKKILHQMIQAFSYDVDFQRSFHSGDTYGLLYDLRAEENGLREEPEQLLYATLTLKGKTIHLYNFKNSQGIQQFYNQHGESVKKGLLRTPIDGARISSHFGNRRHPILGYTKAHKGIDFAAPLGTPVMASGDGIIDYIGPYANYGNFVRIKHNNELSTAYAHLNNFAKGLKLGSKVRQSQIIGFVGLTGQTTGPHLHYELIRFKQQINPASLTMMPTQKFTGKELGKFKKFKEFIDNQYRSFDTGQLVLIKKELSTSLSKNDIFNNRLKIKKILKR